jgi:hypothetical protein
MKNKWVLMLGVLLVCGLAFIGCDNGTTSVKTIASEYRGKWQLDSIKSPSELNSHLLPYTFNGTHISSGGYEIGDTYEKTYRNGDLIENMQGMYSEGNTLYESSGYGYTVQVTENGTKLTVASSVAVLYLTKVSEFSWE